jgi:DNA-binding response OmpR family regulator
MDDDEQALVALCITLRAGGFENLVPWSGAQETLPAEPRSYSLVIVDLNTPLAASEPTLRYFASLAPEPPLLVLAGTPWRRACQDGEPGIQCLVKPVDRDRLLQSVRRIVGAPGPGAATGKQDD